METPVQLRAVQQDDLPIFFDHQADPEAAAMAAFPPRDRPTFMAHWTKILADPRNTLRTVLFDGKVAGNMVAWHEGGTTRVGYWLGKEYWGMGIATRALSQFLLLVRSRPVHAHVASHNAGSIRVLEKCGFTPLGAPAESSSLEVPEGEVGYVLRADPP